MRVLYAESFTPDAPAQDLLGALFTALNLSLKDTIQSQQDMLEISFGDKVVHLATGTHVTSLLITSEKTLMTTRISKFLTKKFEQEFHSKLSSDQQLDINTDDYMSFKNWAETVSQYFTH